MHLICDTLRYQRLNCFFRMTMKLRILGCSGGIGGDHLRTTALRVDDDILIDAGTGVAALSIDELAAIDHVFITHAHLDHIAALPLMLDTIADRRTSPLVVHGTAEVLEVLRRHIFNWAIWPDFAAIPSADSPFMRYEPLVPGAAVDLGGRRLTALPVNARCRRSATGSIPAPAVSSFPATRPSATRSGTRSTRSATCAT